jgi:glutamate 5-kinase
MRFVVKIGTNLITNDDNTLDSKFIESMVKQIATLRAAGHEPLIVTSGAVAAGRQGLTMKKESKHIPYRQALASIGQTFLLDTYRDAFKPYEVTIGQVLLTMIDFEHQKNFISTRNTLELLLAMGVVPIINENDVTTFNEIKFGDNDNLSARLASLINAETLIILTDVEGLLEEDPSVNPDAKLIQVVEKMDDRIRGMGKKSGSSKGLGGMYSKVHAAEYAMEAGVEVWVANGKTPQVVENIVGKKSHHGTCFKRQFTPREARRKWLQMKKKNDASIQVDAGAVTAMKSGKSLLPSGIKAVEGDFERGDVINIVNPENEKIGFGQVNYSSDEVKKIKGKHSTTIADHLGYSMEDEVIHQDNMVT